MVTRKLVIYFIVSFAAILSLAVLLFSMDNKKEMPVITDEYSLWESSVSSDLETVSKETVDTVKTEKKVTKREKSTQKKKSAKAVEKTEVSTENEYVYIDLNLAGMDDLIKLKGIGKATAIKIIEYRNVYGPFYHTYDIMNVSGIGEGTYTDIKEHIYVTYSDDTENTEVSTDIAENEESTVLTEQIQTNKPETTTVTINEVIAENTETEIPLLDVNKASSDDFMKLPGIDRETAESIVNLRTSIQKFENILELLYADKMTESKFNVIKKYIYIE